MPFGIFDELLKRLFLLDFQVELSFGSDRPECLRIKENGQPQKYCAARQSGLGAPPMVNLSGWQPYGRAIDYEVVRLDRIEESEFTSDHPDVSRLTKEFQKRANLTPLFTGVRQASLKQTSLERK